MGCVSSKAESEEINESLKRDLFPKFMVMKRDVDKSMTGLAKALHSTRATMKLLAEDSEKNKAVAEDENGEMSTQRKYIQLERSCFYHLENLIHHEEHRAIECVCKLLKFITNAAEEHLMARESEKDLELERYSAESKTKVWNQASDFDIKIKRLENEIKHLKRNNELLKKHNETLTITENETKKEMRQMKEQIKELEYYQTETQDLENTLKNENQSKHVSLQQCSKLQKELEDARSQHELLYDKLFNEKEALRTENENMKERRNEIDTDISRERKRLQDLLDTERDETKGLHLKISEMEKLREIIESNKEETNENVKQVKTLEMTIQKMESDNVSFKKEVCSLQETKKKLEKRISGLKEREETYKKEKASLESENISFDSERRQLRSNVEQLQKNLEEKEVDIRNIQEIYDAAKKELEYLKSKKVLQVQLYHQSRVALLSEVENEFKALLKSKMEDDRTEITFINCNRKYDIDPDKPLLILCIGASRLGTDAKNAIHELNLTSKMALLIFHHKDVHALPNQASERVLTGQEFKPLGEIIDMAFLSSRGIYSCEMNDINIKNVIAFLRKEE